MKIIKIKNYSLLLFTIGYISLNCNRVNKNNSYKKPVSDEKELKFNNWERKKKFSIPTKGVYVSNFESYENTIKITLRKYTEKSYLIWGNEYKEGKIGIRLQGISDEAIHTIKEKYKNIFFFYKNNKNSLEVLQKSNNMEVFSHFIDYSHSELKILDKKTKTSIKNSLGLKEYNNKKEDENKIDILLKKLTKTKTELNKEKEVLHRTELELYNTKKELNTLKAIISKMGKNKN